jgi:hypothetical protein
MSTIRFNDVTAREQVPTGAARVVADPSLAELERQMNVLRPEASVPDDFAELTPHRQREMQCALADLSEAGRLFRQLEPGGPLLKAGPTDAFHALDNHAGLAWVVDRSMPEQKDQYTGSPLLGWRDLDFISIGRPGPPAFGELPPPDETTLTDYSKAMMSSYWQKTGWTLHVPSSAISFQWPLAGTQK